MNSSQFMDKQIMDLSRSQSNNNNDSTMFDLLNPPQEEKMHSSSIDNHVGGAKKEDILPSYDFQPIRPVSDSGGSNSVNLQGSNVGGTRVWSSADSKANSSARNHSYLDPDESTNFTQRNDRNNAYDATILSNIDRTMKKHADILLHSLEGVSARLCQMETRTRNLESLVDDLKVSVENDHGSTDGKLRQLENILREVQTGVQVLRDKQDIAAAHLHLMKPQASNGDQQPEIQNTAQPESVQHIAPAPQQSHQSYPPQVGLPQPPQKVQSHQSFPPQVVPSQPPQQAQSHQSFPPQVVPPQPLQQVPAANSPNVHPPATQQNQASVQLSSQVPPSQILSSSQHEHYFPPPGHLPESTHQPYQVPLTQQLQSPSPGQPQHYQSAQFPQYPQSSQPPQQHPPVSPVGPVNPSKPHLEPQVSHPPEETPYMAPQSYPPNFRQSSVIQPASGGPTSQQYYGSPVQMYEPPVSRSSTGFSPGYGPSSGTNFSDSYLYGGPHYSSSSMKQPQLPSSPSAPSGGSSSYPRLPTAQILPHALPTASSAGGGPDSSNTGNRVPIDDVVDKVATMGFSREQVRATVRKLTENGQSVDLNVVLDKLMNDGEIQPQKGWFGR